MSGTFDEAQLIALYHDPDRATELAEVLQASAEAAAMIEEWRRQDAAIGTLYAPLGDEPVPARLGAVIRNAETPANLARAPRWQVALAAGLLVALGGLGGWSGAIFAARGTDGQSLVAKAVLAHETYVVEVRHPVEVAATDSQHLQTWLNKRVGQTFTPPILTDYGYNLLGGRIVPVEGGAAALLMYEDADGGRITLYIAAEPGKAETAFRFAEADGVQSLWWVEDGLGCAVSGDLPRDLLRDIGTAAYDQIRPEET